MAESSAALVSTYEQPFYVCFSIILVIDLHQDNPRFATYCPYCQISSTPSLLPQGLRDPPSYTPSRNAPSGAPPPYTPTSSHSCGDKKESNAVHDEKDAAEDALHFLNHDHDSIASLSLRYDVPADALRRANNITSDHLLLARKTILIPGEYYKDGVSLSPRPVEGEKEELRKGKIRRFMTSCKVSDYDMALLYLEQSEYDLEESMQAYFDDEAWERRHPQACASRGLAKPQRFR